MKATYALPVLLLLTVACSDSATAPPASLVRNHSPSAVLAGDPPPPPVRTSVVVCVSGAGCVVSDGLYFSNGTTAAAATTMAAAAQTDGACTFPGPSWLRFKDATTTELNGGSPTGSAKGRIQCSQLTATGAGSVTIAGVTYELAPPFTFQNTPTCLQYCASFTAAVTLNGQPAGTASGTAFEASFFDDAYCYVDEFGVTQCFAGSGIG